MTYKPLSVRRGIRQQLEGHPGVPAAARYMVRHWLEGVFGFRGPGMRTALMAQVALAVGLVVEESYEPGGIMEQIISAGEADDDLYLDILDAVLHMTGSGAQPLRDALEVSGSVWSVSDDQRSLVRRVDATATDAAALAASPADEASDQLKEAWAKVYGRAPDPSDAWDHAIKALEAVLIPLVVPTKAKATLGDVLGALRATPTKYQLLLSSSHSTLGSVATLEAMLRLLWPNPDRHGGAGTRRTPSLSEAEAVVHLAVTVVQWARTGTIQ